MRHLRLGLMAALPVAVAGGALIWANLKPTEEDDAAPHAPVPRW
jgi:hypothetical protein